MKNSGMLVCSFRFRERYKKDKEALYCLNQPHYFEQEDDLKRIDNVVEMFRLFCETHVDLTADVKKQKVFAVKENSFHQVDGDTYTALSFVIKSGSYGIEAEITNKNTNKVTHRRSADESDVKDFYCVVYIPKDVGDLQIKKGIFVFQSIGNYGVKTITTDMMRTFFAIFKLTLETRSVSVAAFLEKLVNQGSLYKLTLIQNRISPNSADNMLISTGREEQTFIRPRFQPEGLRKLIAIFNKADETGIVEIPDDVDYDDISIQFKLGDRKRTVRLGNLERISIIEDIPDHIMEGKSDKKLIQYMIDTADAYKERIVWGEASEV